MDGEAEYRGRVGGKVRDAEGYLGAYLRPTFTGIETC